MRALQSTAPPWLVCGFPLREVSWSFSESLSGCCLWAFVVSTLSFVQELINASSKALSIFFFFSSVSCFPGSLSYMLGVPGEHEEGRRALGILFIYFLPALLLSQASYLWSQGRKWRGLRGQGCLGSPKDQPAESAWWLSRVLHESRRLWMYLEGFPVWFCS